MFMCVLLQRYAREGELFRALHRENYIHQYDCIYAYPDTFVYETPLLLFDFSR